MPHVPRSQQERYIADQGYIIFNHSGLINDAPLRIKHLATEMVEPGFYAANLDTHAVLGPYQGSDATVITNIFSAVLIMQLSEAGYALIYMRDDGTAEWDDLSFDGKLPRNGLTPGFYVISYTQKSKRFGPAPVAEIVLQDAAVNLGWLLGYTVDDKIHTLNIQIAAGALAIDLYEFTTFVYANAHSMLEYDGGDAIFRIQEWAAGLEDKIQAVAEALDEHLG